VWLWGLTFELSGPLRQDGLARVAKMYRVPPAGPRRPAVAGPRLSEWLGRTASEAEQRVEAGAFHERPLPSGHPAPWRGSAEALRRYCGAG